ncbi:hypothetical protein [Providencia sp. PROV147]|uniref:hypothetical protein n=1 Tax=Providencia sp. PROV147 TaxID=2949857 RepID=UPI00234AE2FF|nr:hypothetical protein [Providencia sp. PROV147]
MKKLLIAVSIVSTTLLLGCSEEKKETAGSLKHYLETREDMLPYNLEFESLGFNKTESGNDMLCGKIRISRKSSLSKIPPRVINSDSKKDINEIIDSGKYFHFYFFKTPTSQDLTEKEPVIIVDMYDTQLLESWNKLCK